MAQRRLASLPDTGVFQKRRDRASFAC